MKKLYLLLFGLLSLYSCKDYNDYMIKEVIHGKNYTKIISMKIGGENKADTLYVSSLDKKVNELSTGTLIRIADNQGDTIKKFYVLKYNPLNKTFIRN